MMAGALPHGSGRLLQDGATGHDRRALYKTPGYDHMAMSVGRDDKRWPRFRQMTLGLLVVASTITADLAGFSEHLDLQRVMLFCLSGVSAASVALMISTPQKKVVRFDYARNHPAADLTS
jgi:hypothetical protein